MKIFQCCKHKRLLIIKKHKLNISYTQRLIRREISKCHVLSRVWYPEDFRVWESEFLLRSRHVSVMLCPLKNFPLNYARLSYNSCVETNEISNGLRWLREREFRKYLISCERIIWNISLIRKLNEYVENHMQSPRDRFARRLNFFLYIVLFEI